MKHYSNLGHRPKNATLTLKFLSAAILSRSKVLRLVPAILNEGDGAKRVAQEDTLEAHWGGTNTPPSHLHEEEEEFEEGEEDEEVVLKENDVGKEVWLQ